MTQLSIVLPSVQDMRKRPINNVAEELERMAAAEAVAAIREGAAEALQNGKYGKAEAYLAVARKLEEEYLL